MFRRCRGSGELHIRRECGVQAFCRRQNLGADGIYFRPGRERFRAPVGRQPNGTSAAMRSEFHKGYQSISDLRFSGVWEIQAISSCRKCGEKSLPQDKRVFRQWRRKVRAASCGTKRDKRGYLFRKRYQKASQTLRRARRK